MTNAARQIFEQDVLPLFEMTRDEFLAEARAVAERLGADGRSITIDDVREICPPPAGSDPRVMGAVFQCGKSGPWEKVGYEQSQRKACHGRPIAVFKLRAAQ